MHEEKLEDNFVMNGIQKENLFGRIKNILKSENSSLLNFQKQVIIPKIKHFYPQTASQMEVLLDINITGIESADLEEDADSARREVYSSNKKIGIAKTYVSPIGVSERNPIKFIKHDAAAFAVGTMIDGLVNVPVTVVCEIDEAKDTVVSSDAPKIRLASLQKFIEESTIAINVQSLTQKSLCGLVIFDYLIGYADGRGKNALVLPNNELLAAIDNGRSFVPWDDLVLGHYEMLDSDVANIEISQDLKIAVSKFVQNPDKLNALAEILSELLSKEEFQTFNQRLFLLKQLLPQCRTLHNLNSALVDYPKTK